MQNCSWQAKGENVLSTGSTIVSYSLSILWLLPIFPVQVYCHQFCSPKEFMLYIVYLDEGAKKKKTRMLSYESKFSRRWETWATSPNISCFLNSKVRFWSVYVFFIKKKKLGVKNKGTIPFTNHFDLGWKENSLIKIDWDPVELSRKTVMISRKPRRPPGAYLG